MATPAAILSMLVKVQGVTAASADLRGLDSTAKRTASGMDDASRKSSKTSAAFAAVGKAARVAGPLIGAAGLAAGVKAAVGEYEEAQKVGANTNAVIKSTGGIANITRKGVENLAGAISKKSGIDDEQIQKGANLLLTFKNIRNETGKGRDIFNQATQAATDLSAAGFGSLESTSKQLGKALNDPIKGMTALGRSGVTFSEDQKKAIEALINTGKTADRVKAQQLILREVQSQVGGQAAAQATATDKLNVALGNLAEAAGSVLVPMLEKGMTALTNLINQFIEGKGIATVIIPVFNLVKDAIASLVVVVASVVNWFKQHQTVAVALGAALATLGAIYLATLIPAAVAATVALVSQTAAWIALNAAMLLNPFVLVAVALAALVAGIVVAYRESETFRNIVTTAWEAVKIAAQTLWTVIKVVFSGIAAAVVASWNAIKSATTAVWGFIGSFLSAYWSGLKAVVTTYFNAYRTIITTAWGVVRDVTVAVWGVIRTALTAVWGAIRTVASTVWAAIRDVVTTAMRTARDVLAAVWTAIRTAASTAWGLLRSAATAAWNGIRDVILTPIRNARDTISDIWHQVGTRAAAAWENLKKGVGQFAREFKDMVVDAFKGAAGLVVDFVNTIIGVINKIPGVDIEKVDKKKLGLAEGGTFAAQAFARGGAFRKTGGFINRPMTFMGEEAPRHPEYVIPTNPQYRGRAQGLLAQAAGAIGMQSGGVFGYDALKNLWTKAGGPESLADTMAAIALAESGGRATARNPSGASGLWQILGQIVGGNIFDPMVNARNAVAKWRTQGLKAWVVYTTGAYKQFLHGKGPIGNLVSGIANIGGIIGDLLSGGADFLLDKLPGVGDLPGWMHGMGKFVLGKATSYIKDKVAEVLAAHATTGPEGGQDIPVKGGFLQLPKTPPITHQTGGLAGFPAADIFAPPGTRVGSPVSGKVSRLSGQAGGPGGGGPYGYNIYLAGEGLSYFLTHFGKVGVRAGQAVKRGQVIGTVADYPDRPDHIHEGYHRLARGGVFGRYVGSYANGGVVPQTGMAMVHRGETITPAGGNGSIDALTDAIEAQTELIEQIRASGDSQLTKTLVGILSAQIVGQGLAGRRMTPGNGQEYRY